MKVIHIVIATILLTCLSGPVLAKAGNGWGGGSTAALTEQEAVNLTFLREEEKLARDVYLVFHHYWGATIFANIAVSEQNHMDAVERLIITYGLEDPAENNGAGVFTNTALQELYHELVERGTGEGFTLADALDVGVLIEEMDIEDIEGMQTETGKRDIERVLANLLAGSFNHLAAFEQSVNLLESQ